jgi:hypothetical protein
VRGPRSGSSGKAGGDDFKRHFKPRRGEIRHRGAHVAYGLTLAWASSNEEDGEVIASHMRRFLTKHVIAGQ